MMTPTESRSEGRAGTKSRTEVQGGKHDPAPDEPGKNAAGQVATKPDHAPGLDGLLTVCLIVASLYFAREILMPVALAMVMAFLLAPLVEFLERIHLGRVGSAIGATFLAVLIFGLLFLAVFGQITEFGRELPKYEESIHAKLRSLGAADGGLFGQAAKSINDFQKDLNPTNTPPQSNPASLTNAARTKSDNPPEVKPVPVVVHDSATPAYKLLGNLVGPSLNLAVMLFLVTVFCAFFLAGRDDLHARMTRIMGSRNARVTDKALNDSGRRVSRYLLMQLIVNFCYGIPIGLGLWAIGIPTPLLWGMVAALLRYIPYAGAWIAAFMPFAIGFGISSGWSKPLMVFGLFCVMEIITANFVEPWLYGNSTGITPLAVLLAAAFWTWLWGPIGLLLAMPLTVCLVSIARYVPQLEVLEQLFGEAHGDSAKQT